MTSFKIVTAHNFFVLHNNRPFNHKLKQSLLKCRTERDTLFLSCFHCGCWVVLHSCKSWFVVPALCTKSSLVIPVISSLRMDRCMKKVSIHGFMWERSVYTSSALTRRSDDMENREHVTHKVEK